MKILQNRCIGCGLCIIECPMGAIKPEKVPENEGHKPGYIPSYIDPKLCENCGACLISFQCVADALVEDDYEEK